MSEFNPGRITKEKQDSSTTQYRRWFGTMNNPKTALQFDAAKVQFAIYQLEIAPTTKTPHFQMYLVMKQATRRSAMSAVYPATYWVAARGTHEQVKTYCSKTESRAQGPWTFGTEPAEKGSNKRSYDEVKIELDAGRTFHQVAQKNFGLAIRHPSGIQKYIEEGDEKRNMDKAPLVRHGTSWYKVVQLVQNLYIDI